MRDDQLIGVVKVYETYAPTFAQPMHVAAYLAGRTQYEGKSVQLPVSELDSNSKTYEVRVTGPVVRSFQADTAAVPALASATEDGGRAVAEMTIKWVMAVRKNQDGSYSDLGQVDVIRLAPVKGVRLTRLVPDDRDQTAILVVPYHPYPNP